MMTLEQLAKGHRAYLRHIKGPDKDAMSRLDEITAQARKDMGARYDELNKER